MKKKAEFTPWKTVKSKTIYKGKYLTFKHDDVLLPNSKAGVYDYIEKNDTILIIPKLDDAFYLVQQYRYTVKQSLIEFPQGTCDAGEDLQTAAIRETEEELGLKPQKIELLGRIFLAKGSSSQAINVFLATHFEPGSIKLDSTEQELIGMKVSEEKFREMIRSGQIIDSPTLAAYTLYQAIAT